MQTRQPIWKPTGWDRFREYWLSPLRDYLLQRRHAVFVFGQVVGVAYVVYWWRVLPPPGYAIALLAILAAAMSLHGEMRAGHKAAWMVLLGFCLGLEFRAIRHDREEFSKAEGE